MDAKTMRAYDKQLFALLVVVKSLPLKYSTLETDPVLKRKFHALCTFIDYVVAIDPTEALDKEITTYLAIPTKPVKMKLEAHVAIRLFIASIETRTINAGNLTLISVSTPEEEKIFRDTFALLTEIFSQG